MIVLDASAVVEWLLGFEHATFVEERIADPATTIHVPHLLGVEVAQVVRRFERRGEISDERAREVLVDLADLDAMRYDHEPLLPLVWELRSNLTAYDASYVALARVLDAPLVTLDTGLAAAPHGVSIQTPPS